MPHTRFQQVVLRFRVLPRPFSRHQRLRLAWRHPQIQHQAFSLQSINPIFQMFDPLPEFQSLFRGSARHLMRQVGSHIPVRQHNLSRIQRVFNLIFRFKPVPGIKQRREMWIHIFQRTHLAIQKFSHHRPEPRIVLRKSRRINAISLRQQRAFQQLHLRALAAPVNSFHRNQFSACCHRDLPRLRGRCQSTRCFPSSATPPPHGADATTRNAASATLPRRASSCFYHYSFICLSSRPEGRRFCGQQWRDLGYTLPLLKSTGYAPPFPHSPSFLYNPPIHHDSHPPHRAGTRHFGENRVQEWEGKRSTLSDLTATWHLIGHLQSNKAARAARTFDSIDAVDDFSLAQKLDRSRAEISPASKLRVLIEVHLANEETKSGVAIADLPALAEKIIQCPSLTLAGLMCIPPFLEDIEQVRPYFSQLRKLRDDLTAQLRHPLPVLSMGMSHDFEVAIEEGATEVRIGTALFGTRVAV